MESDLPNSDIMDDRAKTPDLDPTQALERLTLTPQIPDIHHNIIAPPTPEPAPASLSTALRYPDTLGTLIEVRASEEKGLGVFALTDILPGTILISEAPLVILQDTGARIDPLSVSVAALSPTRKKAFLSLYAFSRNKNESHARSIVYSNGYSIMNDLATGVFETASRVNHSCVPNSHYVWKESIGRIVFYNRFKLLEGEEVTVDYGHRKGYLKKIYGFDCMCGGCTEAGSVSGDGSDARSSSGSESGGEGKEMGSIDGVLNEEGEVQKS